MNFLDYSYAIRMRYLGNFEALCTEFDTETYLEHSPHQALAGRLRLTQRRLEELAAAGKPAPKPQYRRDKARRTLVDCIASSVKDLVHPWTSSAECIGKYWPKSEAFELKLTLDGKEHDLLLDLEGDWPSQIDAWLFKLVKVPIPVNAPPMRLQDPDFLDTIIVDEAGVMPSPRRAILITPGNYDQLASGTFPGSFQQFVGASTRAAKEGQKGTVELVVRDGGHRWEVPVNGVKKSAIQLGNEVHAIMETFMAYVDFETLEMNTIAQKSISRGPPPKSPAWTLRPEISQLALEAVQGKYSWIGANLKLDRLIQQYSEVDQATLVGFYAREIHRFKEGQAILRDARHEEGDGT